MLKCFWYLLSKDLLDRHTVRLKNSQLMHVVGGLRSAEIHGSECQSEGNCNEYFPNEIHIVKKVTKSGFVRKIVE